MSNSFAANLKGAFKPTTAEQKQQQQNHKPKPTPKAQKEDTNVKSFQDPKNEKAIKEMKTKATGRHEFKHNGETIYEWEQNLDEGHLYMTPPPGISKHDFEIKFEPKHLKVGLKATKPFLDEDTGGSVVVGDCFWMIEDGELHIQLGKVLCFFDLKFFLKWVEV